MRLSITRRAGFALAVLLELADGRRQSSVALAAAASTTTAFLPKVMRPLVRRGWVESLSGPYGGYRLRVDPHAISVLDVIEAIDGPVDDGRCLLPGMRWREAGCPFGDRWEPAKAALIDELRRFRVADGLDPPAPQAATHLPEKAMKGATQ